MKMMASQRTGCISYHLWDTQILRSKNLIFGFKTRFLGKIFDFFSRFWHKNIDAQLQKILSKSFGKWETQFPDVKLYVNFEKNFRFFAYFGLICLFSHVSEPTKRCISEMVRDTACALKGHHLHRFIFDLRQTGHFLQIENPAKIFPQVHLSKTPQKTLYP